MIFRLFRSRLIWLMIGVLTAAGTAYWLAVAVTAVAVSAWTGDTDPDAAELATIVIPVGVLAAAVALVLVVVVVVIGCRHRARRWVQLREQMLRDAATEPGIHVAQVLSRPNPSAGGHVQARDLITGYQGPLWLPGWSLPRNAVVCFARTPYGGEVRAWMTRRLWLATSREAARVERLRTQAHSRAERAQNSQAERRFRIAADQAIAEAERILSEQELR